MDTVASVKSMMEQLSDATSVIVTNELMSDALLAIS